MDITEAINERVEFQNDSMERLHRAIDYMALLQGDIPSWLEGLDIGTIQPYEFNKNPEYLVQVNGTLDDVKAIQRATGTLLKREVLSDGKVIFYGRVQGMHGMQFDITVFGDLPLAPGCRLEPYEETVTKFKVVCPEPAKAGAA